LKCYYPPVAAAIPTMRIHSGLVQDWVPLNLFIEDWRDLGTVTDCCRMAAPPYYASSSAAYRDMSHRLSTRLSSLPLFWHGWTTVIMLLWQACQTTCLAVCVCVSVCLSVREHISGNTRPIFTNFCACYLWPWFGPPLAAWRYVMYLV